MKLIGTIKSSNVLEKYIFEIYEECIKFNKNGKRTDFITRIPEGIILKNKLWKELDGFNSLINTKFDLSLLIIEFDDLENGKLQSTITIKSEKSI